MIDLFSLALSHGLMLIAAWRLAFRPDVDDDAADPEAAPRDIFGRAPKAEGDSQRA
ncbi:MAG: hypothetical protein RLN87_14625 [Parasphingopyxis sp.]|uniref:hypothetical protein n=1 Tax=Parasphingopyxis sp. TaxID=1920299 RepID=UPI0026297407|nr:hypothetical protein [uncultured Parasphingopyxis sp.]